MTHTDKIQHRSSEANSNDIKSLKEALAFNYEEELEEQLEDAVRNIYFYEQSYLIDWVKEGVISQTINLNDIMRVPNYCLHFYYKLQNGNDSFSSAKG